MLLNATRGNGHNKLLISSSSSSGTFALTNAWPPTPALNAECVRTIYRERRRVDLANHAVVLTEPRQVVLRQVPVPEPRSGVAVVQIALEPIDDAVIPATLAIEAGGGL